MGTSPTRAFELLRAVHRHPGLTRADAARRIGIGTGAATELVARLTSAELISERPASPSGSRGRPTTVLLAHPRGPLVVAASITHESWRADVVELGGATLSSATGEHDGESGDEVVARVAAAVAGVAEDAGPRLRGLGIAGPGTVTPALRLDASQLDWHDVDLSRVWPGAGVLVAGNDATLAATAEACRGAAAGASVALHLQVEAGLGGALVDGGKVLLGATGTGGEFGHMPFGDAAVRCPCGAFGCWGTDVDGSALARHLGHPEPRDPVSYARRVIRLAAGGAHPAETDAVERVARALGRGIAGLVNALDPDLVTLGGLARDLLDTAGPQVSSAYEAGLMGVRRSPSAQPPPVVRAALGVDGPIAGAAEEAWARLLPTLLE
jgi:predicted NBD/HSP70 family sugar kinase